MTGNHLTSVTSFWTFCLSTSTSLCSAPQIGLPPGASLNRVSAVLPR